VEKGDRDWNQRQHEGHAGHEGDRQGHAQAGLLKLPAVKLVDRSSST
jgi:hypothetical protein